ncbi:MAG: hypothetical protein GF353_25720 [Candidatus Lokiarchaeota archaeon]|nr:hypothetical protein [Candidatus Lokiarchaeota archaeon]
MMCFTTMEKLKSPIKPNLTQPEEGNTINPDEHPFFRRVLKKLSLSAKAREDVEQTAQEYFILAKKQNILRRRSANPYVCACLHLALQDHRLPIYLREICDAAEIMRYDVKKAYWNILKALNLRRILDKTYFLDRYLKELEMERWSNRAMEKKNDVKYTTLSLLSLYHERYPKCAHKPLYAAAIYLALKLVSPKTPVFQNQIYDFFGVSGPSFRKKKTRLLAVSGIQL